MYGTNLNLILNVNEPCIKIPKILMTNLFNKFKDKIPKQSILDKFVCLMHLRVNTTYKNHRLIPFCYY
jgi:hypothetical protein